MSEENTTEEKVTWNNVMEDVNLDDYREDTADQTTESVNETSEEESAPAVNDNSDVEKDTEEYVIEIDGEEYDLETVSNWKKQSDNKDAWQKSNTLKSQNLARLGKLSEELTNNEDLRDHIKDFYLNDNESLTKLGLDSLQPLEGVEPTKNVEKTIPMKESKNQDVEILKKEVRELAVERRVKSLESQLNQLEAEYPQLLGEEDGKTLEFLKYADDNKFNDLEKAFKNWSYPKMEQALKDSQSYEKNKSRNRGKVVNTSNVGSKGDVKPAKKLESWKDVSVNDPSIAKYFEKE